MSDRRIRPFSANQSSREVEEGIEALSDIFRGIVGLFQGPTESPEDTHRQRQQQQSTSRSSNRNAEVALGVAGIGLAVGAIAGTAYYLFSDKSENTTKTEPLSSRSQSFGQRPNSLEYCGTLDRGNEIVIAADATERRAGGILRFPKYKKGYFYSIDWSNHFNFSKGPDKFEMTNILLALNIFEEHVADYRNKESAKHHSMVLEGLVCKNDNAVWGDQVPYQKNATFKRFYQQIENKLESKPFYGRSQHSQKQQDDDMRMADKLSRERDTEDTAGSRQLPKIPPVSNYYDHYTWYNLSKTHSATQALNDVKDAVPNELKFPSD